MLVSEILGFSLQIEIDSNTGINRNMVKRISRIAVKDGRINFL